MQEKSSLDFSGRLALALKSGGVRASHLAEKAGVSKGYVSELLKGNKSRPSIETCKKFAEVLSIPMIWLFDGGDAALNLGKNDREKSSATTTQSTLKESMGQMRGQLQSITAQVELWYEELSTLGDFSYSDLQARLQSAGALPVSPQDARLTPAQLWGKYAP